MPNIPSFEDAKQAVKDRIPENIKERIPSNVDEFVEKIPYADKINTVADKLPKVIGPKTHAIIDFAVAGSFLAMGAMWLGSHKRAADAGSPLRGVDPDPQHLRLPGHCAGVGRQVRLELGDRIAKVAFGGLAACGNRIQDVLQNRGSLPARFGVLPQEGDNPHSVPSR